MMDNEKYNDNVNESAENTAEQSAPQQEQPKTEQTPYTSYGEYSYKRPESAQQTSYVRYNDRPQYTGSQNQQYSSYTQSNPYQSAYNPYAQQSAASNTEKEFKSFKKTMYRLLAGVCALALVIGVAGGSLVGYSIANRDQQPVTSTAPNTTQSLFQNNNPTTTAPAATTSTVGAAPSDQDYEAPSYLTVPADSSALPVQQIYQTYVDAVVSIYVETTVTSGGYYYYGQQQSYTQQGAGSGVIISEEGYIATNNHVIEGADKIRVCLQDGREYEAALVGTDEDTDVALIKIEADDLTVAPIGDSDSLMVGDQAIVIGNPLGKLSGTLTVGYISALNRELTIDSTTGQTMSVIQTDAAVNPGNSGGAMFNAKGELVGIIFAKTSDTDVEGLGYAIPINAAIKTIDDLVEHGYVTGRPSLGIQVITIDNQMEAMMYRVNYLGVYVSTSTNPENGFMSGDLIISVNGAEVGDYASLTSAIRTLTVGDTAAVEIMRNGQKMTLNVPVIESVPTMIQAE